MRSGTIYDRLESYRRLGGILVHNRDYLRLPVTGKRKFFYKKTLKITQAQD